MTRTRKLTLSMREFSHLVSESLDIANMPVPIPIASQRTVAPAVSMSFVKHFPVVSENTSPGTTSITSAGDVSTPTPTKSHPRPSSFQRILDFARPGPPSPMFDDLSLTVKEKEMYESVENSRKTITWPFSRSPRKNRAVRDELESEMGAHFTCHASSSSSGFPAEMQTQTQTQTREDYEAISRDSITSLAAASTSSLGSLLPAHERLFQVMSKDGFFWDETYSSQNRPSYLRADSSSPLTFAQPVHPSPGSGHYATRASVVVRESAPSFGNTHTSTVSLVTSANESQSQSQSQSKMWCQRKMTQSSGTGMAVTNRDSLSHSLSVGESDSSDEDPTPRASTFGNQTKVPSTGDESRKKGIGDTSIGSQPATNGVVSETLIVTVTPRARTPSPTSNTFAFPQTPNPSPTRSRSQTPTASFDITRPPKVVTVCPADSPRQRPRTMSRTLTTPPLPRPPPTGPLPAVPSDVPPVPPLPSLLSKKSTMKMSPPLPISLPPRVTSTAVPAIPPSPPGGLRLPSRLSWVNSVRAVLPSPPSSPRRLSKDRPSSTSPSRDKQRKSGSLKRPTSIGVIDAVENGHVRRAKSILLLASRSKSHASLGTTKRVQIHVDAITDSAPSRKVRRKSSAAAMGPPSSLALSNANASVSESALPSGGHGSELLVPRERRHSAPLLSSTPELASADWTLSLPFCTDVPGNQISDVASPLLEEEKSEASQGEDWTLCMPLKVRVAAPSVVATSEGCDSECVVAETTEMLADQEQGENRALVRQQLPTPAPSPTPPSPPASPGTRPLDIELEKFSKTSVRPGSPASLGPHCGGLAMDSGRGKRGSGWYVYGWFDEVDLHEEVRVPLQVHMRANKSNVAMFRRTTHESANPCGRNLSQDTTFTASTDETMYYSARSSLLVD